MDIYIWIISKLYVAVDIYVFICNAAQKRDDSVGTTPAAQVARRTAHVHYHISMHVCNVYACACRCICMYMSVCRYPYVCMCVCVCVCVCVHAYAACMRIPVCACLRVCVCLCLYICPCMCMHVLMCICWWTSHRRSLPIFGFRDEILKAVYKSDVVCSGSGLG